MQSALNQMSQFWMNMIRGSDWIHTEGSIGRATNVSMRWVVQVTHRRFLDVGVKI